MVWTFKTSKSSIPKWYTSSKGPYLLIFLNQLHQWRPSTQTQEPLGTFLIQTSTSYVYKSIRNFKKSREFKSVSSNTLSVDRVVSFKYGLVWFRGGHLVLSQGFLPAKPVFSPGRSRNIFPALATFYSCGNGFQILVAYT